MHEKAKDELTELGYWWVFAVSLLSPLSGIGIETAWVFRYGRGDYQALVFYFDSPVLWVVASFEFFFTLSSVILFQRWLRAFAVRWVLALTFCALWTVVAFLMMPGVTK